MKCFITSILAAIALVFVGCSTMTPEKFEAYAQAATNVAKANNVTVQADMEAGNPRFYLQQSAGMDALRITMKVTANPADEN